MKLKILAFLYCDIFVKNLMMKWDGSKGQWWIQLNGQKEDKKRIS